MQCLRVYLVDENKIEDFRRQHYDQMLFYKWTFKRSDFIDFFVQLKVLAI